MNPSNSSYCAASLVALGLSVLLASSPNIVSAADPTAASRTVKFADLNISNASDAHRLYMRILAAAQVVCSYVPFASDADTVACVQKAVADAVTRIHQPELSAVYNAKNSTPVSGNLVSQSR